MHAGSMVQEAHALLLQGGDNMEELQEILKQDPTLVREVYFLSETTKSTLLFTAARGGLLHVVKLLLKYKAPVNWQTIDVRVIFAL